MKKTKKMDKRYLIGIGFTLAFLLVFAVSYGASAEFSFIERFLALSSDKYAAGLIAKTDVGELSDTFGAMPGNELFSDSWTVNGVERRYYSSSLRTSSTTLCSFKSPNATSTLLFASIGLTTSTTTTVQLAIGKAFVPTATTTSLGEWTIAAGQLATVVASTSPSGGTEIDAPTVFSPSTYLNFKYGGESCNGTASCSALAGKCKAEFIIN